MRFLYADDIISYDDYDSSIRKIKKFYKKKINKLHKSCIYDKKYSIKRYIKYRRKYKILVRQTTMKCLSIFKQFLKDIDYIVLVNGSFARDSFRDASDVDVAILYDNKRTKEFLIFEELFCFALSSIMNLPRDKIHNVFSYLINQVNENNYDRKFQIEWKNDKFVKYECRPNTEFDMYLFRISSRKYDDLMYYIEDNMNKNPTKEWLRSYDIWYGKSIRNIANDILVLERKIIKERPIIKPHYQMNLPQVKEKMRSVDLKNF